MQLRNRLILIGLSVVVASTWASAADQPVKIPNGFTLSEIRQVGSRAMVRSGSRWYSIGNCAGVLCTKPTSAQPTPRSPAGANATPERLKAVARTGNIREAWYSHPTTRYQHGILGDIIEAARLNVRLKSGRQLHYDLPKSAVFEDLKPRLVDFDGDGNIEVVTLRSTPTGGGAVAVYRVASDAIKPVQQIAEIGRGHRWLNIAGIHDWTGNGRLELAVVQTPHIGGRLQVYHWKSGKLKKYGSRNGFSNHVIGSRFLDMSVNLDIDGDGKDELILPTANRGALSIVSMSSGVKVISNLQLDRRAYHNLAVLTLDGSRYLVYGTSQHQLRAVTLK
jgi:hypothetical protein